MPVYKVDHKRNLDKYQERKLTLKCAITANNGVGYSGFQTSVGGLHLPQLPGTGRQSDKDLFRGLDPKAWHPYEILWDIDGLPNAPDKIVSFLIDGNEFQFALKSEEQPVHWTNHFATCKQLRIGSEENCRTSVPFRIDSFRIWSRP